MSGLKSFNKLHLKKEEKIFLTFAKPFSSVNSWEELDGKKREGGTF